MLWLFAIVCVLALAVLAAWNFIPGLREKMRGWSTIAEAILTGAVYWFGQVSDGIREAQQAGYLPTQWVAYVPYILLAWMIIKRVTTSTPVGKKE